MGNKHKTQVAVYNAEATHGSMPSDFVSAVKDIKLAILQARANAARLANAEALKLYFYVGGYISKKTRSAKWGSGAIDALSNQLQVELPGLRGFSATNIKNMRAFFEFWADDFSIRQLPMGENCSLATNEIRQMSSAESALIPIRQMPSAELGVESLNAFMSVGFSQHRDIVRAVQSKDEAWYYICASAKAPWSYEQLLQHLRADDYHHIGALPNNFGKTLSPMALATKAVRSFRDEYLLELVNLDNADAVHDQDVDERVLSKALVADVEKTIQALGAAGFGCGCAAVAFVATDGRCSALADLGFSALGFFGPCCCTLAVLGFSWPRPIHHHTPPAIAATTTAAATHLAVVRLLSPVPTREGRAPSRPCATALYLT